MDPTHPIPSSEYAQDIDQMVHESLAGEDEVHSQPQAVTGEGHAQALQLELEPDKSSLYALAQACSVGPPQESYFTSSTSWTPVYGTAPKQGQAGQQQQMTGLGESYLANNGAEGYDPYPHSGYTAFGAPEYAYAPQHSASYPQPSLNVHLAGPPSLSLAIGRSDSDASLASTAYGHNGSGSEMLSASTAPNTAGLSPFGYVYPQMQMHSNSNSFGSSSGTGDGLGSSWQHELAQMAGFPVDGQMQLQLEAMSPGVGYGAPHSAISPMGTSFRADFGPPPSKQVQGQAGQFSYPYPQQQAQFQEQHAPARHAQQRVEQQVPYAHQATTPQQWQMAPSAPAQAPTPASVALPPMSRPGSTRPASGQSLGQGQVAQQPFTPTAYARWPEVPAHSPIASPFARQSDPQLVHASQQQMQPSTSAPSAQPSNTHLRVSQPLAPTPLRRALSAQAIMPPPAKTRPEQPEAYNPYVGFKAQQMGPGGMTMQIYAPNVQPRHEQTTPKPQDGERKKSRKAAKPAQEQQQQQTQQEPDVASQIDAVPEVQAPTPASTTIVLRKPIPKRPAPVETAPPSRTVTPAPAPAIEPPNYESSSLTEPDSSMDQEVDGQEDTSGALTSAADTSMEAPEARKESPEKPAPPSLPLNMPPGKFIRSLWSALQDPASRGQVEWDERGEAVIFKDKRKFFANAFKTHFEGSKPTSITRGLVSWGFQCIDLTTRRPITGHPDVENPAYIHTSFQRDSPENLRLMARIKPCPRISGDLSRGFLDEKPGSGHCNETPAHSTSPIHESEPRTARADSQGMLDEAAVMDQSQPTETGETQQVKDTQDSGETQQTAQAAEVHDEHEDRKDRKDRQADPDYVPAGKSRRRKPPVKALRLSTDAASGEPSRASPAAMTLEHALEALRQERQTTELLRARIRQLDAEAYEKAEHCVKYHQSKMSANMFTHPFVHMQPPAGNHQDGDAMARQTQMLSHAPPHWTGPQQPQIPVLHVAGPSSLLAKQSGQSMGRPSMASSSSTTPLQSRNNSLSLVAGDTQSSPGHGPPQNANKRKRTNGQAPSKGRSHKPSVSIARNRVLSMQGPSDHPMPYSAVEPSHAAQMCGHPTDEFDHRSRSESAPHSWQGP